MSVTLKDAVESMQESLRANPDGAVAKFTADSRQVQGLQSEDPATRQSCADGLGRLSTNSCPMGTPGGFGAKLGDFVLKDVEAAVTRLHDAVPNLE